MLKTQLLNSLIMQRKSIPIRKQVESVLSEKINYYLQAFWQKCSAL